MKDPPTDTQVRSPKLDPGSRVGVIGGGPAGSFFSYFLLQIGQRTGQNFHVDIYEPRDFEQAGPRGCNMCGGIISESLVQNLATEGINLPSALLQRRIDSYTLHMDVGSVRIETPLKEQRIAAVHRGACPRFIDSMNPCSFDRHLLGLAADKGARVVGERVDHVDFSDGRPQVVTQRGSGQSYDLLAVCVGVNSSPTKLLRNLAALAYQPPRSTKAYICEFYLGLELIERYLGNSMHVFLLDLPRLEFAALIPKSNYVTVCLLGEDIDKDLVESFLHSREVRQCMPPQWKLPENFCHCSPRITLSSAVQPFADRLVFVGDCGTSRLYKDGIGAAYRTGKAAAVTAAIHGVSAADFQRHYWPACQTIRKDNNIGKLVFAITRQIRKRRYVRRGVWRMVSKEQRKEGARRRMSGVLWDTFTGSAPYRSVFLRGLHPAFVARFFSDIAAGIWPRGRLKRKGRLAMPTLTGAMGRMYKDGEIICRQGELGDCMYVIQGGKVEVLQRRDDQEFCLAELGKGDFFGEMALFGEEARPATVRAIGQTLVFTLERTTLLRRIHEDPSLALRMLEKMSKRIQELETALVRAGSAVGGAVAD